MKDHINDVKDLYAPNPKDSPTVRRCKLEMAAIMSRSETFKYEGQTCKVQTRDQAIHRLGLNRRWQTDEPNKYRQATA